MTNSQRQRSLVGCEAKDDMVSMDTTTSHTQMSALYRGLDAKFESFIMYVRLPSSSTEEEAIMHINRYISKVCKLQDVRSLKVTNRRGSMAVTFHSTKTRQTFYLEVPKLEKIEKEQEEDEYDNESAEISGTATQETE